MVWSRKTQNAVNIRNGLVWLSNDGYQKVDVDIDLEAPLAVKYKVNAQRKKLVTTPEPGKSCDMPLMETNFPSNFVK